MSPEVLTIVAGIATPIGLASLLGYLYAYVTLRKKEQSITSVLKGEGIADGNKAIEILQQFEDQQLKLKALRELTKYDAARSQDILKKIEANVDLNDFTRQSKSHIRSILLIQGVVFVLLGACAFGLLQSPAQSETSTVTPAETAPKTFAIFFFDSVFHDTVLVDSIERITGMEYKSTSADVELVIRYEDRISPTDNPALYTFPAQTTTTVRVDSLVIHSMNGPNIIFPNGQPRKFIETKLEEAVKNEIVPGSYGSIANAIKEWLRAE